MFISYLKKNYEKVISTFVTVLFTLFTNEFVNSSEISKKIVEDGFNIRRIIIWIFQIIVIMIVSIMVEYLINRSKINKMRNKIRFKKNFPFQNCTKFDKEKEIDNKIQFLQDCILKIKDSTNEEPDTRLHLLKQTSICLNELLFMLINLIYYKEQCITLPNEHPIDSKFSISDMKYYFKIIVTNYDSLKAEVENLDSGCLKEMYQKNEINHVNKNIKRIDDGITDAENLLKQLQLK